MTVHLWKQDTPVDDWEEVTISEAGYGLHSLKVSFGYSHPATAEFTLTAAQHTIPIPQRAAVLIYDDSLSTYNDFAHPIFEGHVIDCNPGSDANEVFYMCMDPTRRATEEITIFNDAWDSGSPPTPGTTAYPRAVFNVTIDNDDDYPFAILLNATVGEIITQLFDDQLEPLKWANAAPTSADPYSSSELAYFVHEPQDKLVFEGETFRRGLQRLLVHYPKFRMIFFPGNRVWHFVDVTASSQVTLTLNDHTATNVVLSMKLTRSLEGRATAIKFYGPETLVRDVVSLSDETLAQVDVEDDDTFDEICPDLTSITLYKRFQIVDTDRQHMARSLLAVETANVSDLYGISVKVPFLQAQFEEAGTWYLIQGCQFDTRNGIVAAPTYVGKYREDPPTTSDCHWQEPIDIRLTYCYFAAPTVARYPSSGFSGTAYSASGMSLELAQYDDMLAIGYENNNPVTSEDRIAAFEDLAQSLQEGMRDLIHTGSCVLDGIKEDFFRLNKRVNIAAIDADGDALTTGWESANMILTDVEIDFDQSLTSLTFSSDLMELTGEDPSLLRERLKIRALQQANESFFRIYRNQFGQITLEFSSRTFYVDSSGNEVKT